MKRFWSALVDNDRHSYAGEAISVDANEVIGYIPAAKSSPSLGGVWIC